MSISSSSPIPTSPSTPQWLADMRRQNLITVADEAIVERRADGKIKLRRATDLTGAGAAGGALWGGLIGMLFFMPLLGMALGAGAR